MPDSSIIGGKVQNCRNSEGSGGSGCQILNLTEENIRFVLLALILYIYLCLGAFIFQAFEETAETEMRESFHSIYSEFKTNLTRLNEEANTYRNPYDDHHPNYEEHDENVGITEDDLLRLLYAYGNATKAGAFVRQRWDWVGSFHFAWTIVSTIGYGATTPITIPGQLLIIPYGFFGCAGGLLFFNLFLERIITFLTGCMRCYRDFRRRRSPDTLDQIPVSQNLQLTENINGGSGSRPTSGGAQSSHSIPSASTLTEEKPSVTWVMISLFIMSSVIILASAGMYHQIEGWTYVESLYFAFVSYSTIGFGDFVTFQQTSYGNFEIIYRIVAFGVMVFGCCCIYSLLNVTSIVIKRFLNWIINTLDCPCCICCACLNTRIQRSLSRRQAAARMLRQQYATPSARSPGQSGTLVSIKNGNDTGPHPHHSSIDMEDNERRYSGENLVVLRRELSNKVTMAVMQKRLFETSRYNRNSHDMESEFSVRNVGPLAIVSEKFGDSST